MSNLFTVSQVSVSGHNIALKDEAKLLDIAREERIYGLCVSVGNRERWVDIEEQELGRDTYIAYFRINGRKHYIAADARTGVSKAKLS